MKCSCRRDRYARLIIRFFCSFHNSRFLTELTSYFLDHLICCLRYGFHGKCREQECKHSSDKQSDDHTIIQHIDTFQMYCLRIRSKQCQCCQRSRTDCKAFSHSCCCISYRIQFISDFTYRFVQTWHFCDSAGIIGDRTICIHRNCNSSCRKHSHCCQSNSVQSVYLICYKNTDADQDQRDCCWLHSDCDSTDDRGCRSCLRLLSDLLHRIVICWCIAFCNQTNENTYDQTCDYGDGSVKVSK